MREIVISPFFGESRRKSALPRNGERKILTLPNNTSPMSQKQASGHNGLKRCANLYQNKTAHHG